MSPADDYLSTLLKGAVLKTQRKPLVAPPSDTAPSEESTPDKKHSLNPPDPSLWTESACEISEKLAKYLNPWIDLEDSTPHGKCPELFGFKDLETPAYAAGAFRNKACESVGILEAGEAGEEWWGSNGSHLEDPYYYESSSFSFPGASPTEKARLINDARMTNSRPLKMHTSRPSRHSGPHSSKLDPRSLLPLDSCSDGAERTPRFLRDISSHVLRSSGRSCSEAHEFCSVEGLRTLASSIYVVSRRMCPQCSPGSSRKEDLYIETHSASDVDNLPFLVPTSSATSASSSTSSAAPSSTSNASCFAPGSCNSTSLHNYMDNVSWSDLHFEAAPSHHPPSPKPQSVAPGTRHATTSLSFLNATLALLLFIHRLQKMETQRRITSRLAGSPSGCASSSIWKQQKKSVSFSTAISILVTAICFLTTVQKADHSIDHDNNKKRHVPTSVGGCCSCPGFAIIATAGGGGGGGGGGGKSHGVTQSHSSSNTVRAMTTGSATSRRRVVENAKKLIVSNSAFQPLVKMVARPSSSTTTACLPRSAIPSLDQRTPHKHHSSSSAHLINSTGQQDLPFSVSQNHSLLSNRAITYPVPALHGLSSVKPAREMAMSAPLATSDIPNSHHSQSRQARPAKTNILTRILSDVKSTSTKALLLPLTSKLHSDPSCNRRQHSETHTGFDATISVTQPADVLIRDCTAVLDIIRRFCSAIFVASAWIDELEPISSAVVGDFLSSAHLILNTGLRCRRFPAQIMRPVAGFGHNGQMPQQSSSGSASSDAPTTASEPFGGVRRSAVQLKRIAAVTASTISGACMNSDCVELVESPSCLICREAHSNGSCSNPHARHPGIRTTTTESQMKKSLGLTSFDFERLTFKLLSYIQYDLRIDPNDFWWYARIILKLMHRYDASFRLAVPQSCSGSTKDLSLQNAPSHRMPSNCQCSLLKGSSASSMATTSSISTTCGCSLKAVMSGSSSVLTSTSSNSMSTTVPASRSSGLRTQSMPFSSSFSSSWLLDDPF